MYVFNVVINLLDLHGTLSMFTHTVSNLGFEGTATCFFTAEPVCEMRCMSQEATREK